MAKDFRLLLLAPFFIFLFQFGFASNSDSIDVHHTNIMLDSAVSNTASTGQIYCRTTVTLSAIQNNVQTIRLDLQGLTVDSVFINGTTTTFSHDDTLLIIQTVSPLNVGDSVDVSVHYHGFPDKDNSTFGGFYFAFSGQYVYNIGVGFNADPHTFGRVWYPCKDNFTDRSTYEFHIRVDSGKMAVCGGTLTGTTQHPDGSATWHWNLRDNIPSYLTSMAISDYVAWRDTFVNLLGDTIPVDIYARQPDSARIPGSFSRLMQTIDAFEQWFGPYRWERVGFVVVPFNGGAMEHSTNIAYPRFAVNGAATYETLWAHELSHQWFGDLVTCEYQEDMWLNEGWAAFCEALSEEANYGSQAYKDYVRINHSEVLRYTHYRDGGYRAVSGIPHSHTYGSTVYDKGALVAHSLRWYMSDSLFWPAVQHYLDQKAFNHANSDTLQKYLEANSGLPLTDWFDTWVYEPGFTHFSLDSFSVAPNGPNFDVTVHIRQRLKGTTVLYNSNKMDLRMMDENWNSHTVPFTFSGQLGTGTFTVPFEPTFVMIDPEEHIADATTDNYRTISALGYDEFPQTWCAFTTDRITDSAFVRVVHNWVAPDSFKTPRPGIRLSDSRYWTLEGIFPPDFNAQVDFTYSATSSSTTGWLDNSWLTNREDSLLLFYRPDPSVDWEEAEHYRVEFGNSGTDGRGRVELDSLKAGEYALGIYDGFVGVAEPRVSADLDFQIYPNPAEDELKILVPGPWEWEYELTDISGKSVVDGVVPAEIRLEIVDLQDLPAGVYLVKVRRGKVSGVRKLVVE